jgi:CHAD domain-containing protein
MEPRGNITDWAQRTLSAQVDAASDAIRAFCAKPSSAKRLHRMRRRLARLRAALDDLAPPAGVAPAFSERISRVHRRAGKVRDTDVLLKRVETYCRDASGEECLQLERVRKELRKRARRMRRKLMREIGT